MYKAIVIDDEVLVREAIILLARWSDFDITEVFQASNAREALELIAKERPHLIITDMKMPEMDGIQLLKKISELELESKILVVSGYSDFDYTRQAIKSNVLDYILKPVDAQDLNNAISMAIKKIEKDFPDCGEQRDTVGELIPNKLVYEIDKYIRENFDQDLTLEELSNKFYVCKEHISRTFKKEFNTNLFDYIAVLKIQKAKELMLKTQYSIEEIALKVGFSNGNYFSKAFKKQTGITPSEFRANR